MYFHSILVVSSFFVLPVCRTIPSTPPTVIQTTTNANTNFSNVSSLQFLTRSLRQLVKSAPYTIESNNAQNTKNIVLHLAINQTQPDAGREIILNQNGTLIGTGVNLNIEKLLETLNNNNFTKEVKFDNNNDTGFVNITISNLRELGTNNPTVDELLELKELLVEANSKLESSALNDSSVVKDNHHYQSRHPIRSKLAFIEAAITIPPIRSAVEIVAENYTMRKVADEANVFSMKLLHQLNIEKLGSYNLIQNPFAIYQGLAVLLTGAMGETAKEINKALLGGQSSYENTKLTHDQDQTRLLNSLNDVIHQLQQSSTHHLHVFVNNTTKQNVDFNNSLYLGGTIGQHLIMANNLLFSANAYEISNEFKNSLNTYYNNTALTQIEVGSTESIKVINAWIRRVTAGNIPSVFNYKDTFDDSNVMALLCTSWIAQEWKDTFYRISSPTRSSIRLKGQGKFLSFFSNYNKEGALLEFVDDNKNSYFVDYIKSKPTKNIRHYNSVLDGLLVDIVEVPFKDSNHRLITLTPIASSSNSANATQTPSEAGINEMSSTSDRIALPTIVYGPNESSGNITTDHPDSSPLSRLTAAFAGNPHKSIRSLWNIIAPEIITKRTLQNIQLIRQKNITIDGRTFETIMAPMVQISIPIIRGEADSSLSAALNHIGIVNSFDPNQANFIGINGHPFNDYKLHLNNVLSKTTFNLNERGINYDKTIKTLESMRIFPSRQEKLNRGDTVRIETNEDSIKSELIDEVTLNKPFMYLICDIKTKLILYTGIMRNPIQEGP